MLHAVANTLLNSSLILSSVTRMATEDPIHFAIQLMRRTPASIRDRLSTLPEPRIGTIRHDIWALLLDRYDTIRATERNSEHPPRLGPLMERLNIEHGEAPAEDASSSNVARFLWHRGLLTEALTHASGRLQQRYAAQRRVLDPSYVPENVPQGTRGLPARIPPTDVMRQAASGSVRVLHVLTNSLPWTQSGYALRSHSIIQAQRQVGIGACAMTRLAYPITVGRLHAGTVDVIDGVTYGRVLPWRLPRFEDERLARYALEVARIAQRSGAEVLHTTTPYTNAVAVASAARALDIPWVYEMRGELEKTWLARHPADLRHKLQESEHYQLMRARESQMAHEAHAVVVLSAVQKESLIERGIPADKIHIVANAVDDSLLKTPRNPTAAQQQLGLPQGFWVGCVTSLVDYEGLDTLLRAVAFRRAEGSVIRCAVVGDGVSRASLRALAKDLGISEWVEFPGRVGRSEVTTWYGALDVMVIPRKDTEVTRSVTPLKGLQAMALGLPQVVSDLPALVEVGSADGQGISFPAEDPRALAAALRRLENDPSLCVQLGGRGREVARERTWHAHAHQTYLSLYQDLTQRN